MSEIKVKQKRKLFKGDINFTPNLLLLLVIATFCYMMFDQNRQILVLLQG